MIAILQIFWRMWQWKNFENRPVFDEVMCRQRRLTFFGPPCTSSARSALMIFFFLQLGCRYAFHGRGCVATEANHAEKRRKLLSITAYIKENYRRKQFVVRCQETLVP